MTEALAIFAEKNGEVNDYETCPQCGLVSLKHQIGAVEDCECPVCDFKGVKNV